MTGLLHTAFLCAAFWTAVLLYRGGRPLRFVAGLGTGAALSHLGWAAQHWPAVSAHPSALLDPMLGHSVLFFPLGPLLLRAGAASWRALPLALVVARLGCLVSGCCGGTSTTWGAHPTPLYSGSLLLVLHFAVRAVPQWHAVGVFLAGLGLERLLVQPWRAAPPLGKPALDAAWLGVFWLVVGLSACLLAARRRGGGNDMRTNRLLVTCGFAALLVAAGGGPPEAAIDALDPSQRVLALRANERRWGHDSLPELVELESDPDPVVRAAARGLVRRYLIWGASRPGWRERRDGNRPGFEAHDRAGLILWRERGRQGASSVEPRAAVAWQGWAEPGRR